MECQRCHRDDDNHGLALVQIVFPPFTGMEPFHWLACIRCINSIMNFVNKDDYTHEDIVNIITGSNKEDKLRNTDYIR